MSVFLPVAGISVAIWIPLGAGVLVGFLSGLLGVGGGFLLTPILIMAGIPPTIAAASDSCQIVAASSSGAAAHWRLGNVDLKMGITLLAGGLVGAGVGVQVIKVLRALGNADSLITVTYIVVLAAIGGSMFVASLKSLRRGTMTVQAHRPPSRAGILERLPFQVYYQRSNVRHSLLAPISLAMVVGILASIMGVGGAFMAVPMMVYLLGMPAHVAVGTSLFQTLFTCAGITYMQSTANHTVDLVLALLLAAGSTIGAQIGARMTRFLRGDQPLIILAILALAVAVKMLIGVLVTPANLLTPLAHASLEPLLVPGLGQLYGVLSIA
ncbi:MAG: sulfite exporter TauE/SafE family protein [Bryobacteraceae bacterium]